MVSVVVPVYAWLKVWKMWLLCSAKITRSSSSLMSSLKLSSRLKFARSFTENFSLVIDAANCRQLDVYKRGTLARAHAFVKQAESVPSAHTVPSSFAQRYGEMRAPGVCSQRNSYLKGRTYAMYESSRSPMAFSKNRILSLYAPDCC